MGRSGARARLDWVESHRQVRYLEEARRAASTQVQLPERGQGDRAEQA